MPMEVFTGITMDPGIRFGKPCVAGTRIDAFLISRPPGRWCYSTGAGTTGPGLRPSWVLHTGGTTGLPPAVSSIRTAAGR